MGLTTGVGSRGHPSLPGLFQAQCQTTHQEMEGWGWCGLGEFPREHPVPGPAKGPDAALQAQGGHRYSGQPKVQHGVGRAPLCTPSTCKGGQSQGNPP